MRTLVALLSIVFMIGLFSQCQRNQNEKQQALRKRSMMDGKRDTVPQSGIGENSNRMRDQMRGMMQQMMPDMLPPGIEPDELPERNSQGAQLLSRYCTSCHSLPSPAMHSAGEWPAISGRMFRRMEMMGGMMGSNTPSADEQKAIVSYLKEHAMTSVNEDQFKTLNSEGSRLFLQTCSQCHALPDPKLHTPQEWEQVVERMRGHMETMGKNEITDREKEIIVEFLENHVE